MSEEQQRGPLDSVGAIIRRIDSINQHAERKRGQSFRRRASARLTRAGSHLLARELQLRILLHLYTARNGFIYFPSFLARYTSGTARTRVGDNELDPRYDISITTAHSVMSRRVDKRARAQPPRVLITLFSARH